MFDNEDWDDDDFGGVETPVNNQSFQSGFSGGNFNGGFSSGDNFGATQGKNGCFNRGDEGRMSRDYSNGGDSKPRGCFKCGEEGHMSRDCPNGGDSKPRGCFKCGEEGHMSRECPNGGDSKPRGCFKCGEEGHMSRDCPNGGDSKPRGCFKCGEEGHMARDCPSSGASNANSKGCFKCGEEGHISRDCPSGGGGDTADRPPPYIPPPPPEDEEAIYASTQTGINFNKYDAIPVEVTGMNPPSGVANFDDAGLPETIRANVGKAKYTKPTPVQKHSIPIVNAGRDLMACAQTGSGKTAAFLLPVLAGILNNGLKTDSFSEKQTPQAIIVGPTRELVNQIFYEALKFARNTVIRPVVAYGGTSVMGQLRELGRGCNMLIATPGRLLDFIGRGRVGCEHVEYLILDEADRMLDMGFEPEIRRLIAAPGMPDKDNRHTLMFSATFPDEIQKLAHDFLKEDFLFLTVGRVGGACSDVTQSIIQVDKDDKREKLMELVSDVTETAARTLVFVDTKRNADFLASFLSQEGLPTTSIHGDRQQREREVALADFKSGRCPILIATSVAARGLDIPKVEHVINYDLPAEVDEYVHRIGRTGRCGNLGTATSFYCDDKDGPLARSLVKILSDAQQDVPEWLESCAMGAVGTHFGPKGGRFGARDARAGGGGGSGGSRRKGDYDYNDGNDSKQGFSNVASSSAVNGFSDDDDAWD